MSVFHLKIVTADGKFFDGEAERVLVRTIDGDIGILAHHINLVTALGYGEASVTVDGNTRRAACIGGLLFVMDNEVRLVPTTFEWAESIDVERAQRAKDAAEQMIRQNQSDKRELALAEAKLKRALVRLGVKQ